MKRTSPGKTLVIGCQSYIGKQFYAAYKKLYPDTLGTHYLSSDPATQLDLLNPQLNTLSLKKGEYEWAIIAAAHTNLSRCEQEKESLFRANVEGTLSLIEQLVENKITPIVLSSDYVFDGVQGGYRETDPLCPINEYGKQKALLEEAIPRICKGKYLIVRCSKIFGLTRGDKTLIDQIVTPLLHCQPIKAATDQFFAPVHERDVINAIILLQTKGCLGLFNLCGSEIWNRLDLAKAIGRILSAEESLIEPISLDDLPISYRLPKRTYMNCDKLQSQIGAKITPLSRHLDDLAAQFAGTPEEIIFKR